MNLTKDDARERLERARADQELVRITRRPQSSVPSEYLVAAVGSKWFLAIRIVDGAHEDGFEAMRLSDVRSVKDRSDPWLPVLRTKTFWPPAPPHPVLLDSTSGMVRSLGSTGQLIGLERERRHYGMWIGQFREIDDGKVWIEQVDSKARWEEGQFGYKLRALTTVHLGGRYIEALAELAGPPRA